MADTWLTIEQAAVALGLSVRTVNRHIVAGKIQSRLHDGRREVLVDMPDEQEGGASAEGGARSDPASPFAAERLTVDTQGADYARQASDYSRQTSDRVRQASESSGTGQTIDPTTVLALADNAAEKAELAISAYQALAHSTNAQFQNVRRSARVAWTSVAVMAAAVSVAVGWTTHHLTKAHVEGQYLRQAIRTTTDVADKASMERESLRAELSAAREQAARAEGKVSAIAEQARGGETDAPAETVSASDSAPDSASDEGDSPSAATQPASVAGGTLESQEPTTHPAAPGWFLDRVSTLLNDKAD